MSKDSDELSYTNNGDGTGHTVWRGGQRIGRVMRQGPRWMAFDEGGRFIGQDDAMSRAGQRVNEAQHEAESPVLLGEAVSICAERDWDHPLVGYSYCAKPPGHDGDHDFHYDGQE